MICTNQINDYFKHEKATYKFFFKDGSIEYYCNHCSFETKYEIPEYIERIKQITKK